VFKHTVYAKKGEEYGAGEGDQGIPYADRKNDESIREFQKLERMDILRG
jgi:hypothetical protein